MFGRRWAGWLVVGLATTTWVAGCSPTTTTPTASPAPSATASAALASAPAAVDAPSPSPIPGTSVAPALVGAWAAETGLPALTLNRCAAGEVCGRFERVDDNAEHCIYTLEYRPPTSDHFVFWSADANSFGCGYSGWWSTELFVRPMPDGTVAVSLGNGLEEVRLGPVDSPPVPSATSSRGG